MVFVLHHRFNGKLYSVMSSNHIKPRPVVLAFKEKKDAIAMLRTIKNIDDAHKHHPTTTTSPRNNSILGLSSVQQFLNSKVYNKQSLISTDYVHLESLLRKCTLNCLDVMLIEDNIGTYTMYHLNVLDNDNYIFHLNNCIKYW